jgi:hypothetical protein
MNTDFNDSETRIVATEHVDPNGSVVRSGIALADATLRALESANSVTISLRGLKGASSSYFNVFLRRIEEDGGLAEIGQHIHLEFGSKLQEMVFQRSFDSRAPRQPPAPSPPPTAAESRRPFWQRMLAVFGGRHAD